MPKIVGVALRWNGCTISKPRPARHGELLEDAHILTGITPPDAQGFLTDAGHFVGREAALMIAQEAGQITQKVGNERELFSEDVW